MALASAPNRIGGLNVWRIAWWTLSAIVVVTVIAIRIRLLPVALERDEGEYAYSGQLMLQGIPPYQLAYNMKFPGTYAAYALGMAVFGQTTVGVHLGLLVVNALTVGLVFLLARRLFGEIAALAAAAAYALMSVSPTVLGFAGHATHYVVICALVGAWLLLRDTDRRFLLGLFVSGFFWGLAVLMKQPGIFLAGFGFFYLLYSLWRRKPGWSEAIYAVAAFAGGAALPIALTFLWLWRTGVFGKFWFWTVDYAREYGTRVPVQAGGGLLTAAIGPIIGSSIGFWLLALVGLILCLWRCSWPNRTFMVSLILFSALGVSAGLYFRPHYFILILPAIALLNGVAVSQTYGHRAAAIVPFAIFLAAAGLLLFVERDFFFSVSSDLASRLTSGPNPFPEAVRVGNFLREHTAPDDTIAVIGSEPEIYFYARRHSATGYIYTYGLMEPQPFAGQMQQEMEREIEAARPKYVVFASVDTSWAVRDESDRGIFDWFDRYSARELEPAGLVNIINETRTDYYLPYAGENYTPSPYRLTIYERK